MEMSSRYFLLSEGESWGDENLTAVIILQLRNPYECLIVMDSTTIKVRDGVKTFLDKPNLEAFYYIWDSSQRSTPIVVRTIWWRRVKRQSINLPWLTPAEIW
ncbi:hypothetical protein FQA39_LY05205 [Lamprigera yunnana]|nr:hypothetical protein FQA39_LY05205 [Lamprigera yunnana]